MDMKITCWLPLLLSLLQLSACDQRHDETNDNKHPQLLTIAIIRHAEKPDVGDNLSCQGLNRALALPNVLKEKVGIPDYIYTPSIDNDDETRHVRMLQTITPFAVQYNLAINSDFKAQQIKSLSEDVLRKNGIVLIVWNHTEMRDIAEKLGVNKPPKWKKQDFDSIWLIERNHGKSTLKIGRQMLTPREACQGQ